MTHKVFVYGSLKVGYGNHRVLNGAEYVGVHKTLEPNWEMMSLGGFPGVIRGKNLIEGEVYTVDDGGLERLDRLEGNGSFYNREQIKTTAGVVWMYVLMRDQPVNINKDRVEDNDGVERWLEGR